MKELLKKYANTILNTCLKVPKGQPLFISANYERVDFVRIIASEAYKIGINDIYFDLTDVYLKREALVNLKTEELKKMQFWNKNIWNEYAEKGAAFIMLASETPGLMKDVEPQKISELTIHAFNTRKGFDDMRDKSLVPWCIAAVPTDAWAKKLFPESQNPVNELWNKIFEICYIKEENPEEIWNKKIVKLNERSQKLTSCQFKKLKYTNSLGTRFEIELPKNHLWASGKEKLMNGKEVLVNFPTEEVFTSPTNDSANGIVYSSKPLAYQDNIINNFWIKFENGLAVECGAEEGEDVLKNIISSCENCNRLGEIALVEYESPISKSGIVFYETLYDENAACHLALGASFPECIKNGPKMSKEELLSKKLNECTNHVDFMIGTKDLKIVGITEQNEEIVIFENGNFTQYFQ